MDRYTKVLFFFAMLFLVSCKFDSGSKGIEVSFEPHESDRRIDVIIDGKLFTSYTWPDSVYKPILHPIYTSSGMEITRGYPLKPRLGERADHRHQVGLWLNYGKVNGYDFWGNGSKGRKDSLGGEIKHIQVEQMLGGVNEGKLVVTGSWVDPFGKELLAERTEYYFCVEGPARLIDRVTTLTATGDSVFFEDTKEGMLGLRVARMLELPSESEVRLTDAFGRPGAPVKSNEGVSGNYQSSEGIVGEKVWGKRAQWMHLYGNIEEEKISLAMLDHPKNNHYPTYWHARGYGLLSANPFGVKDFTEGKEALNYTLPAGQSLTLRFRLIVHAGGHLSGPEIQAYADGFSKKY